ncbi:hypothetical protein RFF05_01450 [Bengtsoniella intestinalis]|uniref:hypothetical protein n=1 Tax=Bengtsoniella intestinalis TaxID=3073143 RepID=UPI00391F666F
MSYQNQSQKSDFSKTNKQDECCKTNQKQSTQNQKENRKDLSKATNKKGDC